MQRYKLFLTYEEKEIFFYISIYIFSISKRYQSHDWFVFGLHLFFVSQERSKTFPECASYMPPICKQDLPEASNVGKRDLSRHGVVAAASPGMAAHNALEGEPAPFERAIFLDGFHRILRAGGTVAAGRRRPRRYKVAIDPYQGQHHRLQRLGQIMENTSHSPTSFISRWRSLCILDVAMSHTGSSSPI